MHTTRVFTTADAPHGVLDGVRRLLDEAFGGDFTDDDWDHTVGGRHVVVAAGDQILSHAAVVERTLEIDGRPWRTGYVEGVATDPGHHGRGHGSRAMARIADIVRDDFELGALSTWSHGFYERLGWERWRGPTFVRHGDALVRSADDDAGVMVLRFGPSRAVDLSAAISCEARSGDDW